MISTELAVATLTARKLYGIYVKSQLGDMPMQPKQPITITDPKQFEALTREQLVEIATDNEEWRRGSTPQRNSTKNLRHWCRDVWVPPEPPTIKTAEDMEGLYRGELVSWLLSRGERWSDKNQAPPPACPKVVIRQRIQHILEVDAVTLEKNARTTTEELVPLKEPAAKPPLCHDYDGMVIPFSEAELEEAKPTKKAAFDLASLCEVIGQLLDVFCKHPTPAIQAAIRSCVDDLEAYC